MPEGDSIHRLARRLSVLVGTEVTAFESHVVADGEAKTLIGHTIAAVESRGKNLLVRFDDGRSLHVHLRMLGRVRMEPARLAASRAAYRARAGWVRRTPHQLRLEAGGFVVTGSRIPVLRLLRSADAERRAPDLARLGPDLLAPDFDEDEAVRRLRGMGRREIGDALLVQRAVAGVGNVYKSEALFLERVPPRARVRDLDDATLRRLLRRTRTLMSRNAGSDGPRTTRSALAGSKLWIYGHGGEPCLRCGTTVASFRQGAPPGRWTYHCPRCQA